MKLGDLISIEDFFNHIPFYIGPWQLDNSEFILNSFGIFIYKKDLQFGEYYSENAILIVNIYNYETLDKVGTTALPLAHVEDLIYKGRKRIIFENTAEEAKFRLLIA